MGENMSTNLSKIKRDKMLETISKIKENIDDDETLKKNYAIMFSGTIDNQSHCNSAVDHPAHYCYSKYEPKDVIRGWGLNFNLGSAVKYIARAGRKDDIIQDLEKAKKFLEFEIEALKLDRENGSDV